MANKNLNKYNIREYALKSLEDVKSFSEFVLYVEYLSEDDELFPDAESKEFYDRFVFEELESVNAMALSYWEEDNYPDPKKWEKWEKEHKRLAKEGVELFLKKFNF